MADNDSQVDRMLLLKESASNERQLRFIIMCRYVSWPAGVNDVAHHTIIRYGRRNNVNRSSQIGVVWDYHKVQCAAVRVCRICDMLN